MRSMSSRPRRLRREAGFSAAEAVLLACLLGAACILVGRQLSQGSDTAAGRVDNEIGRGSPTGGAPSRPQLSWNINVGGQRSAGAIQAPGQSSQGLRGIQQPGAAGAAPRDVKGPGAMQSPGAQGAGKALQGAGSAAASGKALQAAGEIQEVAAAQESGGFWSAVSGGVHFVLGTVGLIPAVGTVTNLADAGLYAVEGKPFEASISAASAIPLAGTGVRVLSTGAKVTKAVVGAEKGIQTVRAVETGVKELQAVRAVSTAGREIQGTRAVAAAGREVQAGRGAAAANATRRELARKRQEQILKDGVGYNISPTSWDKYPTIGRYGTFVTDKKAFSGLLKGVKPGQTSKVISKKEAAALERELGLNPGSLEGGFKVRRVEDVGRRAPRSPLEGNDHFLGPGEHLPGGAPELVIDSVPTVDGGGVSTVIQVIVR